MFCKKNVVELLFVKVVVRLTAGWSNDAPSSAKEVWETSEIWELMEARGRNSLCSLLFLSSSVAASPQDDSEERERLCRRAACKAMDGRREQGGGESAQRPRRLTLIEDDEVDLVESLSRLTLRFRERKVSLANLSTIFHFGHEPLKRPPEVPGFRGFSQQPGSLRAAVKESGMPFVLTTIRSAPSC